MARKKTKGTTKAEPKKVRLTLVGRDGNAFVLLGAFQSQARREKWTDDEIETVMNEATSGDYSHLLATLMAHCENGGFGSDDEEDEDDE